MGRPEDPLPRWLKIWMAFTCSLFYYDGLFVLLRPLTLPGGSLSFLYQPYLIYIKYDPHYADPRDSFVFAIGIGNIIEATLHLAVLLNVFKTSRRTKLVAIAANIALFWQTVLFDLYSLDIPKGGHPSEDWLTEFFIVFFSSWFWIVIPAVAAFSLSKDFLLEEPTSKTK